MTLRNRFMTKAMATTALALGLTSGVALAQQAPQSPSQSQPKATQTTPANNNNKGQLVTTWSPVVDPINPLGSHVPLDEKTLLIMIAGLAILAPVRRPALAKIVLPVRCSATCTDGRDTGKPFGALVARFLIAAQD